MINKQSYILFLLGVVGFASFILLRPHIDINSKGAIQESRSQVEARIEQVVGMLGFSMDSLEVTSVRQQHTSYMSLLEDTLGEKYSPQYLNENGIHIQSWFSIIGKREGGNGVITGPNGLFSSNGRLAIRTSNHGNIIRIQESEDFPNPTFIKGESIEEVANGVTGNVLGYNLEEYRLVDVQDSLNAVDEGQVAEGTLSQDGEINTGLEFTWRRISNNTQVPEFLTLNLEPVVKEFGVSDNFRTEFGYKINSFSARNEFEPFVLPDFITGNSISALAVIFFITIFVLTILAFILGLTNIFKGKVEWKRVLFLFGAVSLGIYGWRALFLMSTYTPFFEGAGVFGLNLNAVLLGLVIGLYLAMAYVGWEALARAQKHRQIEVIDATWQRKFFVRETGSALIHGFAVGAFIIGLFAAGVYLGGNYFFQADSQFGFTEPSISFNLLTLNMSSWTVTWLVVIVQIAFVYSLIHQWVSNKWLAFGLSVVCCGLFIGSVGRLQATNGSFFEDYFIFLLIALVVMAAYREYGILTVATGWWVFISVYSLLPYWGSTSIQVAYVGWVQAFIIAGPLIYGFITYRFGVPLSEIGNYIPEYEERIAQHLRVEREIEIARESQYKLMPVQPPKGEGFDVYGFFLPSFEVGGDYFEYVLSKNGDGTDKALTMAVVDVSGKAMRAAMPAIFTSGLLLSRMKEDEPAEILTEVSEPIFYRTDKRTFITCAIARYDLETKQLSVANAGHCKPIIKRNGKADFIQTPDPKFPLGLRPEVEYQSHDFKLKKGDLILLYSDGLPEAVNEKGERFGFDEVPVLLERIDTENLSANEIAQEIKRTVQKFSNYQLVDDTTIICLKV